MVGFSTKRPIVVTIFSILGWIMVIVNFLVAFSPAVKKINEFYPALFSLVMCIAFIAMVGVWYMKRWGVELFVVSFFAKDILAVCMNDFAFTQISFILSVVMIVVLLFFYKRMDRNL